METARRLATLGLALACGAFSATAAAQFVGLLKGGPVELFDKADLNLFMDTAYKALDEGADNQPLAWQNPENGHRGDMTVLKTFESKGRSCKLLRVRNEAQGRRSDMRHNLCKIDGRWKLVGDLKPGAKK
jgi:surface antigen